MASGINCKYTINKEYFKLGSAFYICIENNDFRNGILTNVGDDFVEFMIYDYANGVEAYRISLSDLIHKEQWIVKLKEDYADGKLDTENFNYI